MPAHCRLTGVRPVFGIKISRSHRRTSRRSGPNIRSKRYWLPRESRRVCLKLSARAVKTGDVDGVEAAVARTRARGERG